MLVETSHPGNIGATASVYDPRECVNKIVQENHLGCCAVVLGSKIIIEIINADNFITPTKKR